MQAKPWTALSLTFCAMGTCPKEHWRLPSWFLCKLSTFRGMYQLHCEQEKKRSPDLESNLIPYNEQLRNNWSHRAFRDCSSCYPYTRSTVCRNCPMTSMYKYDSKNSKYCSIPKQKLQREKINPKTDWNFVSKYFTAGVLKGKNSFFYLPIIISFVDVYQFQVWGISLKLVLACLDTL